MYYVVNDEASSTSFQIDVQTKVIQEAVFSGVFKLNDSAINKEQGDQAHFSANRHCRKSKVNLRCYYLLYSLSITPID